MTVYLVNSADYNFNRNEFEKFCLDKTLNHLPDYLLRYNIDSKNYLYILYKESLFLDFINTINDCKVIVYSPIEPVPEFSLEFFKQIKQTLEKNNIILEIWLGNWDENYNEYFKSIHKNIKFINWNRLVLYLSYNIYCDNLLTIDSYDKLFVNLNNKARYHRCLLVDSLAGHSLIDDGYVSWLDTSDVDTANNYLFKYFDGNKRILDFDTILSNHPTVSPNFEKAFINVYGEYTESEKEVIDISEKTWLSILYQKPFLAVAAKGFYAKLNNLGFNLYDEIFDYSFDSLDTVEDRVEGVIQNLLKLRDQDYNMLNGIIKNKTDFNKNQILKLINKKDKLLETWYSYTVQDRETNLIVSKFKSNIKRGLIK